MTTDTVSVRMRASAGEHSLDGARDESREPDAESTLPTCEATLDPALEATLGPLKPLRAPDSSAARSDAAKKDASKCARPPPDEVGRRGAALESVPCDALRRIPANSPRPASGRSYAPSASRDGETLCPAALSVPSTIPSPDPEPNVDIVEARGLAAVFSASTDAERAGESDGLSDGDGRGKEAERANATTTLSGFTSRCTMIGACACKKARPRAIASASACIVS